MAGVKVLPHSPELDPRLHASQVSLGCSRTLVSLVSTTQVQGLQVYTTLAVLEFSIFFSPLRQDLATHVTQAVLNQQFSGLGC